MPSFAISQLTVPSFANHVHHEGIQALLDGGLPNLLLIALGVLATTYALWRRRDDLECRACSSA